MPFQLPDARKIEELLMPYCRDEKSRDFVRWFAQHSGGKALTNNAAASAELAASLDDYVRESGISQVAVNIWYRLHGDAWEKALQSGGNVTP
jgi:hypothetical protein